MSGLLTFAGARPARPPRTQSLARRLLRSVFGSYFIITVLVTLVQLGIEYQHAEGRQQQQLLATQGVFGPGIADALWTLNDDVLQGLLSGVVQLPAVVGAEVRDEHDMPVARRGQIRDATGQIAEIDATGHATRHAGDDGLMHGLESKNFPILHLDSRGQTRTLGHWTVYADRKRVVGEVTDAFTVIMLNSVIKTAALWFIFVMVIRRTIGRPLQQIGEFVSELNIDNLGAKPFVLQDRGHHELHVLTELLNRMTVKLRGSVEENARLVADLRDINATLQARVEDRTRELELLARTDLLTGLFNRRRLDEVMSYEHARIARAGGTLSVILVDVDHFKAVNDEHGHPVGDLVLMTLGGVLKNMVRSSDTVGRWGGEEFMVICPECGLEPAASLAERLRTEIARTRFPVVNSKSCSFGVAQLQAHESIAGLVGRADAALYRAKAGGRDRVVMDC